MFLENIDPILIAIIGGAFGGMVAALYKYERLINELQTQYEQKPLPSINRPEVLRNILYGVFAALLVYGIGQITDGRVGVLAVALLSGLTWIYIFARFDEGDAAHLRFIDVMSKVAKENAEFRMKIAEMEQDD